MLKEENSLSQSQNPESSLKLLGIKIQDITIHSDFGGYSAELLRSDWADIVEDEIKQVYCATSYINGTIKAWHRHTRGQVDYLTVIKGRIELWIKPKWEDEKIVIKLTANKPQLVRVPGHYWHGYKTLVAETTVLYFLNKLYSYENPDEERMEYKDDL